MESEFLGWLRPRLAPHPQLRLGPGDDAALLRLVREHECAVTIDLLSDGVDFELGTVSPRRIGHKALAVNLSDLAAMAAEPLAAVVALLLPREGAGELDRELYLGMIPLAEKFGLCIAGGDVNCWDGKLAISVTAFGQITARGALFRSGAKSGDKIVVTGEFGGSILGRHLDVEPRVREALHLQANATLHAGIDCSDGLSRDLWQLCEASGCGAIVDLDKIPIAAAAHELNRQRNDGMTPLDHALADGEDFELIMAVPMEEAERLERTQPLLESACGGTRLTVIGEFIAERRFWSRDEAGVMQPLIPRGFEHVGWSKPPYKVFGE